MAMSAHRHRRREQRLHDAAAAVAQGDPTGPGERCAICSRSLTDHVSVERGIGPVCWHLVLDEAGHSGLPASVMVPQQGQLHL